MSRRNLFAVCITALSAGDHFLRAFNTEPGEELWKGRLPTAAPATPMTYRLNSNGKQYVVIAAGGHWSGLAKAADHLMAFALPDQKQEGK
ncbi:MAG: hypothetical protein HOC23_12610 [Halieaceae bacterium]|nr:hypothetical protein [Halieaceae bacterium]